MKSYIGVGILTGPYGFSMVGYFIGAFLMIFNGFLNYYSILLQLKT